MLRKQVNAMTYGNYDRIQDQCVCSLDPAQDPRDLIRKMELPQGEVQSENYGFQHTHLDKKFDSVTKSKQKLEKETRGIGCQVKEGRSLCQGLVPEGGKMESTADA